MSTQQQMSDAAASAEKEAWPALWSLVIGFFMILVDSTIVTVATPAIMRGLDAGISAVVWVTSAYLLAFAVPLLITGRLGDRFGPRKIYLIGLVVFTAASAWCGMSGTIGMLVAARVVQGLGASMMNPQTMAVITRTFPPQRRGAAMGLWGAVAGVATLVGPIAGGVLVDALGWEWIFFVNVPVGVIAFLAAWRNVPRLETHSHRFDWLGVALSAVGMFCLVFGIEEGQSYNWGNIVGPVSILGLIVAGLLVMTAFVGWQAINKGEPLVPLGLFADRNFAAANIAIMAMGFIITAMTFPMMLFSQTARGLTPTQAALLTLPTAVISAGLAPVVGKLIDRHNPKYFAIAGFVLLGISLIIYALMMKPGHSILWLLVPAAVMGVASSGIWGPLSVSATRNLPPQRAGAGSGVYNTTRQMGAVLGSAAIAALMEARLTARFPAAAPAGGGSGARIPSFLEGPYSLAMGDSLWLPAAVVALGIAGALLLTAKVGGARRPQPAEAPQPQRAL